MIFVLTGKGKGKTTCALGMGIRAVGAGKKVLMVQFLKTGDSSENKVISRIENFDSRAFGRRGFAPFSKRDAVLAERAMEFLEKEAGKYQFLIMDEINVALEHNLLDIKRVLSFLGAHRKNKHMVLTGRGCKKEIIGIADLVTESREVKHYFKKSVKAIKGIEF